MDKNSSSRWQVRGAAVLIFLLGFVAGALALNAYRAWSSDRISRQDRFNLMSERLKLNNDQKTQVQKILGDTRQQLQDLRQESEPRVKEIRRQADEQLQKALSADQWQQFQQIRNETRGNGQRRRGDGGGGPSPN